MSVTSRTLMKTKFTENESVTVKTPLWDLSDVLSCTSGKWIGGGYADQSPKNEDENENAKQEASKPETAQQESFKRGIGKNHSRDIVRVHTDSRTCESGDLFVPLKGPLVDGHDYIQDACQKGATAAFCSQSYYNKHKEKLMGLPIIVVDDVLAALDDLAHHARARSQAVVIGITGSYGKTSLKESLAHVLSNFAPTHKTTRSFNSHWGVPLTLANLHPRHNFAVIEMGMNSVGEISTYTRMVKPHIAMITNTGDAHIGKLGSKQAIADAKAEIFEGLEDFKAHDVKDVDSSGLTSSSLSIKNDIPKTALLWAQNWATESQKNELEKNGVVVKTFDALSEDDHQARAFHNDSVDNIVHVALTRYGTNVRFASSLTKENEEAPIEITIPAFSKKWALNVSAILTCLDVVFDDKTTSKTALFKKAMRSLTSFSIPEGRGNVYTISLSKDNNPAHQGLFTVVDESYNAAPGSMAEAIRNLISVKESCEASSTDKARAILVIGDMLELGDEAEKYHKDLAKIEGFSSLDMVCTSGEMSHHLFQELPHHQKGISSQDPTDIGNYLLANVKPGDVILVKGSRGQWAQKGRMHTVIHMLRDCDLPESMLRNNGEVVC